MFQLPLGLLEKLVLILPCSVPCFIEVTVSSADLGQLIPLHGVASDGVVAFVHLLTFSCVCADEILCSR